MTLKRLIDTEAKIAHRIRNLQYKGRLKKHIDAEGYICYDEYEFKAVKYKKRGRPVKNLKK